jgi:presenilin-like A22 family membrane protease
MTDATDAASGDAAREQVDGSPERVLDRGTVFASVGIAALYFATILGGLFLTRPVREAGLVVFENPGNVGNVGVFAAIILVTTAVFVVAFRYELGDLLVRLFVVGAAGMLTASAVSLATGVGTIATENALLMGLPTSPVTIALAVTTAAALWGYPEWYVNDVAAVAFGAAAIPMLGLGFGPLPIVVLLVVWAGYDAIAVYGSGHMEDIAAGAMDLNLPIIFVVPTERGFSLRSSGSPVPDDAPDEDPDAESDDAEGADGESDEADGEFGAMVLGVGDALIPGMLAVSASEYLDAPVLVDALNANAPALGAVAGGLVGIAGLLYLVHSTDGMHAGLPPLNAGVLGGYLVGAVAAGIPVTTALGL